MYPQDRSSRCLKRHEINQNETLESSALQFARAKLAFISVAYGSTEIRWILNVRTVKSTTGFRAAGGNVAPLFWGHGKRLGPDEKQGERGYGRLTRHVVLVTSGMQRLYTNLCCFYTSQSCQTRHSFRRRYNQNLDDLPDRTSGGTTTPFAAIRTYGA
ncbi:hypothetical protein CALVIDRAFT_171000 [Calocera viscosa TUFC12733]|uniref:Uncharacterized protein n=1 Tax=Calocera viscosa (strain TUFC12733) TaxID=1330018 RepID=A0A167L7V8_CALVF|nr:hypothetical protein CALVIDRAFT_171000 [Calocera viscosa TUFC12733]